VRLEERRGIRFGHGGHALTYRLVDPRP
jgi:hypothetical protein